MAYNIAVTYILWLFFGGLGIHHLYLGRLNHAIVWFATLGGGGVGWLRDLWRIPSYVEWATANTEYQRRHLLRMQLYPYPPCSFFKTFGLFAMGYLAGVVFSNTVPNLSEEDRRSRLLYYITCSLSSRILYVTGAVMGVYLVANIGETRCDLDEPLIGSLYSLPLVILSGGNVEWSLLFAVINTRCWGLRWRMPPLANNNELYANDRLIHDCVVYCLASATWLALIRIGWYFRPNPSSGDQREQLWNRLSIFFGLPRSSPPPFIPSLLGYTSSHSP